MPEKLMAQEKVCEDDLDDDISQVENLQEH